MLYDIEFYHSSDGHSSIQECGLTYENARDYIYKTSLLWKAFHEGSVYNANHHFLFYEGEDYSMRLVIVPHID